MATTGGFQNEFGEVYAERITFNVRKSLFGGAVREDFPVKHITSVRHETKRWPIWGAILILVGLAALSSGSGGGILIGLVLAALGVVLLVGVGAVSVNTAGGERRISLGKPFQNAEAEAYARAVREAVFGMT